MIGFNCGAMATYWFCLLSIHKTAIKLLSCLHVVQDADLNPLVMHWDAKLSDTIGDGIPQHIDCNAMKEPLSCSAHGFVTNERKPLPLDSL